MGGGTWLLTVAAAKNEEQTGGLRSGWQGELVGGVLGYHAKRLGTTLSCSNAVASHPPCALRWPGVPRSQRTRRTRHASR